MIKLTQNVFSSQNPAITIPLNKNFSGNSNPKKEQPKNYSNIPNADLMKIYFAGIKNNSKNNNKLSFGNAPIRINFNYHGISENGSIAAEQAIKIFELFKNGSYLDLNGGIIDFAHDQIRAHNLSFLDRVTAASEKKKFIDYYKELTGFPNLNEVSERIKGEFVGAIKKAESILTQNASYSYNGFMGSTHLGSDPKIYSIIHAGYDGVCSVAKGRSLPGSDLDKAYVVIRGGRIGYNNYIDTEAVNQFKGKIWENTDQRILSYNHDVVSFPQVYTSNQIRDLISAADAKVSNLGLHDEIKIDTPVLAKFLNSPSRNTLFKRYQNLTNTFHDDYVEANPFFIKLCKEFPAVNNWELRDASRPSRENIYSFGYILEAMAKGNYFSGFEEPQGYICNSDLAQLINPSQIKALKLRDDAKPKRLARERLQNEFEIWPIDKQYNFIKDMIKGSCSNGREFTTEFPEHFKSVEVKRFADLMKEIGVNG